MAKKGRHGRNGRPTLPTLASLDEGPPEIRKINHSVMRSDWTDPDDLRTNVRTGRTVTGHRAFCPLRWCMKRHGARSSFTDQHVIAADKLRAAFDGARIGYQGLRDWRPVNDVYYRPPLGPSTTALRQWKAGRAFTRAWSCLDDQGRAVVAEVVLANKAVGPAAEMLALTQPQATQRLVEALDRLAQHFGLGARRKAA
jgi:hypothetical protein